jgi:hypothetical protein
LFQYPINILCFNRPEYLERLFISMLDQTIRIPQDKIFFWIDGYLNSKDQFLNRSDKTDTVKSLIRQYFPNSHAFHSDENLGIAKNYWRAEVNSFEKLGFDAAIFLEEDLVLSQYYFENLIKMSQFFEKDDDVSHLSPSGDVPLMLTNPSSPFQTFGHNWGYLLKAWHHFERRELLRDYLEFISHRPYHLRKMVETEILEYFFVRGIVLAGTSQDAIKDALRNYFSRISVTTLDVWASNIGVVGEHFQHETPHNNRPLCTDVTRFPSSFDPSIKPILLKDGINKSLRQVFQNYIEPLTKTVAERDALVAERDALVAERDALVAERDALVGSTIWKSTKFLRKIATRLEL